MSLSSFKSCETPLPWEMEQGMWLRDFQLQDSPPLGGKAVNGSSCEGVSGHCSLDIRVWAQTIQHDASELIVHVLLE